MPPSDPQPEEESTGETSAGFADLTRFFRPRRVAVVGATDEPGRQTTHAWQQLNTWGTRAGAHVIPVHPRRPTVDGIATKPDLGSIGGPVDVVAILHADPEEVVAEAGRIGAGFVVVFAAGYAETGAEGTERQAHLLAQLDDTPTRLFGPNTNLNAFAPLHEGLEGPGLAIISQSGHQGRPLYLLQEAGVRITHWAPTGNEADLDTSDLIAWFAAQPDIDAIAAYLEGIRDGTRFIEAGRRAARAGVPVVAVKAGRTAVGADAASSHTAAVTSPDTVVDAAFRAAAIVRADDLDDLADTAVALARLPEPRGAGIAVYSMSGGACTLTADQLAAADLPIPKLTTATIEELRRHVARFLPVDNPIDCGGPPMADERGRLILDAIARDPRIDTIVTAMSGAVPGFTDDLVDDLIAAAGEHPDVAFVLVWGTPHLCDPSLERAMADPNLATFRSAAAAARALARRRGWHERRRTLLAGKPTPPDDAAELPTVPIDRWPDLGRSSEWRSRRILEQAGIHQADAVLLTDPGEATAAAASLGGTVVLKADIAGLAHRGVAGLVDTGVRTRDAEPRTTALLERARNHSGDHVRGIVMAKAAPDGPEVLVGAILDPVFGPVLTVGHGGRDVEDLALTATAIAPRTQSEAATLLRSVPAAHRWEREPRAFDSLVDLVHRISALAIEAGPHLAALEVNPVRLVDGTAVALDAWIGRR